MYVTDFLCFCLLAINARTQKKQSQRLKSLKISRQGSQNCGPLGNILRPPRGGGVDTQSAFVLPYSGSVPSGLQSEIRVLGWIKSNCKVPHTNQIRYTKLHLISQTEGPSYHKYCQNDLNTSKETTQLHEQCISKQITRADFNDTFLVLSLSE